MRKTFIAIVSTLLLVGAGCAPAAPAPAPAAPTPASPQPAPSAPPVAPPVTAQPPAAAVADPYEGWGTITPAGVVALRIPPGCMTDSGAGSTYVVCPTPGNDTPTPDMRVSSDGIQVNIRRWEDQDWDQWNKVIASLRVIEPLEHDIQINVQK